MKKYYNYQVEKIVQVKNLVTIEYHDFPRGYTYPLEEHPFFEFVYVEKGALSCRTDKEENLLQSDFLLITPNRPHEYEVREKGGARVLVVCFHANSLVLDELYHVISLQDEGFKLITAILDEARRCFEFPFKKKLIPLKSPYFASQQMVINYIEQLLISLLRSELFEKNKIEIRIVKNKSELERAICEDVINYLKENLYDDITLSSVCEKIYYSKTYVNNVFRKIKGYSVMQYYNFLKIEEAKKLLKKHSVTYVANTLCFSDYNYFNKVFKKFAGTTPSKYKKG